MHPPNHRKAEASGPGCGRGVIGLSQVWRDVPAELVRLVKRAVSV